MPIVTLRNGVKFPCNNDETILQAARKNGILLEHSCRTGRCGVCSAMVVSGETKSLGIESALTTDTPLSVGEVLTCQTSVVSDVRLDKEDLDYNDDFQAQIHPCRIKEIFKLNGSVLGLTLRFPPDSEVKFRPGQYIDLIAGGLRRSYSIANASRRDGLLELQIKYIKQGAMSEFLFSKAKENDLLRIEGPFGTFYYRDDGEYNVILMATGTGIAPIKALLEDTSSSMHSKNVYVLWGGRCREDLYLNIKLISSAITYLPVLSREKTDDYAHGYIQNAVLKLGLDLSKSSIYACGSEAMIKDARNLFLSNGLARRRFHSDAFVSSS